MLCNMYVKVIEIINVLMKFVLYLWHFTKKDHMEINFFTNEKFMIHLKYR
jgi:hypothetical protein